jgi:hypothetical protein
MREIVTTPKLLASTRWTVIASSRLGSRQLVKIGIGALVAGLMLAAAPVLISVHGIDDNRQYCSTVFGLRLGY